MKQFHFFPEVAILILICMCSAVFSGDKKPELIIKKSNLAVLDKRFHDEVDDAGIFIEDDGLTSYIVSIADRLQSAMMRNSVVTRIKIIDGGAPNAFAFSDGAIYINVAILGMIDNEAQLAFLLAHEIAHVSSEHQLGMHYAMIEQSSKQLNNQMFFSIFGISIGAGSRVRHALGGFSRAQENAADSIACVTLSHAGYNVWEARKFMLTMYRWLAHKERSRGHSGPATHPKLLKRFNNTTQWATALQPDSTAGHINMNQYQAQASSHHRHIIDLLMESNCIFELKEMVNARFAAGDSSLTWHAVRGILLEKYSPVDSFAVAAATLRKACADRDCADISLKALGWLYLKNNMRDSARVCLTRYMKQHPDTKDTQIIQFYLDQLK